MIIIDGKIMAQGTTEEKVGAKTFKAIKLVTYLTNHTLEPIIASHLRGYIHEEGLDMKEASHALASVILTEAANVLISLTYSEGLTDETTFEELSALKLKGLEDARKFFEAYTLALDPPTLAAVYGLDVDEDDPDVTPVIN